MDQGVREKIFDPYFTTKEVGKGTGLGLAMVHGIVRGYGGGIVCDSAPGQGTVFHVAFPVVEAGRSPETGQIPGQALHVG
jgi:signal transduction histidine kinase